MTDEQPIGYWDEHSRLGHEDLWIGETAVFVFKNHVWQGQNSGCNVWILYKHMYIYISLDIDGLMTLPHYCPSFDDGTCVACIYDVLKNSPVLLANHLVCFASIPCFHLKGAQYSIPHVSTSQNSCS